MTSHGKGKGQDKDNSSSDKGNSTNAKEKTNNGNAYGNIKEKTNNGLHLGWYKRADHTNYPGEIPPGWETEEEFRAVHYVNDINTPYTQVLMVSNEEGDYTASYLYGIERIMVENVDGLQPERFDPLYYLYDGLGSASQLVNGEGEVWNKFMYEPFGEPKAAGKLLLNRHKEELLHVSFGFTGEAHDFYSGLIYLRARYYDPGVGSFISRDSYLGNLLHPLSQNRYTYVENNPINYIDPSGHERYITTLQQLTPNLSLKDRIAAFAFAVDDVLFRGFAQKLTGVNVKDAAICENSDELQIAYETNKESLQATLIFMGMMDSTNELDLVEKAPQGAGEASQKVIGHYPEYIEMSDKLGTKPFSIPANIWNKMTPAERWAANQKFLDRAIAKGSGFLLATPIDEVRPGSFLQKEIEYLISQGYKLISDGTKLVK